MFVTVYITCKNRGEAKKVSRHLLKKRLVACCNIFPVESLYRWKNAVRHNKEYAIIAKALGKNFSKIKAEVKKVHSYEVPCVVCYDIRDGNTDFLKWIKRES